MAMVSYPTALPLDCFRTVVSDIQTRQVVQDKANFAQCLWNVQGYLQGMLLGTGAEHVSGFGAAPGRDLSQDENLRAVAEALQQFQGEMARSENYATAMATAPPEQGFWISVILQAVPVILQLLQQLGVFQMAGAAPVLAPLHSSQQGEGASQARETNESQAGGEGSDDEAGSAASGAQGQEAVVRAAGDKSSKGKK